MIAIAGAKGGCGKTVTTLGLAEGFARTGTDAVAIDADRQLPNLHVVAEVDREPTLAACTDQPIRSIAQPSPRTANAGIVPAPHAGDQLDFQQTLSTVDFSGIQPLIDCPSGAGPDTVDALSAADGVIVVTTAGDRSLTAARTTIEMARRLAVPVLGLVVTRCEAVPADVESWVDVPVLGVVPETESPLSDTESIRAYDGIVETLRTRNATAMTPPEYDDDRLPTGIDPLDRQLGGGLPPGSILAVTADPASQAEHLCYDATVPRNTLYLSTERTAANVRRAIESTATETGTPTIRHVGSADTLAEAGDLIEKLPAGTTLVVDVVDVLERHDRSKYVSFLNELKTRVVDTESLALLHCSRTPDTPMNRSATLRAADAVVELETRLVGPDASETQYLSVSKLRTDRRTIPPIALSGDEAPLEPVAIEPVSTAD